MQIQKQKKIFTNNSCFVTWRYTRGVVVDCEVFLRDHHVLREVAHQDSVLIRVHGRYRAGYLAICNKSSKDLMLILKRTHPLTCFISYLHFLRNTSVTS